MWSHEISAATGQFTQQALAQGMYARQISPYDNRAQSDAIAGNMINRGVGFAAPIAGFASSMAGTDSPLSGAMMGGMIGMAGGPLGAGIGAGVGAMVGLGGSAVHAGFGQVMHGMQQQQGFNQQMRQSFGFQRPGGGYGFSGADLGQMSQTMRGMSHQVGSMGEMHSFNELAQLASNMGRMGFAQNVTDAKQFTTKFKQMVDTLKTVSKELGTSLQSAQEMIVGMRQSGIFNTADQIKMAQGMRANSLAGVSMESSSQMANVGSQIARSIGGLGKSGAMAGMRTIQQVGLARKTNTLSEEDIYNATGLTGEEGQMALAQNQMQSSARFLKSGKGRYLLASLAGQNGQLDEESLAEFQSGGMGVGRTRQMAGKNLGKVGRADFIRNEGRLRAEVLSRVGGNVNTLALMGWAGERGIDIENMGDREMLFAQRMLGMGRDEMDVAVKMARQMPKMMEQANWDKSRDEYTRGVSVRKSHMGLQGVKNSFNQFREHTQSALQKVGSDAYQEVSNWVEKQLNTMFGEYSSAMTEELDSAMREMKGGMTYTPLGRQRQRRMFGASMDAAKSIGAGADIKGGAGGAGGDYESYRIRAQGGGLAGAIGRMFGGKTEEDRIGMHFQVDDKSHLSPDQQLRNWMQQKQGLRAGASSMPDAALAASVGSLRDKMKLPAYYEQLVGKKGDDWIKAMGNIVNQGGSPDAQKRWNAAIKLRDSGTPEQKIAAEKELGRMASAIGANSLPPEMQFLSNLEDPLQEQFGKFHTDDERYEAYGKAMMAGYATGGEAKIEASKKRMEGPLRATALSAATGSVFGAAGGAVAGLAELFTKYKGDEGGGGLQDDMEKRYGDPKFLNAMGRLATTEQGKELTRVGFEGTQKEVDKLAEDMRGMADKAAKSKDMNDTALYESHRTAVYAGTVRLQSTGDKEKDAAMRERVAKSQGYSSAAVAEKQMAGLYRATGASQGEQVVAVARELAGRSGAEADRLTHMGIYDASTGGLSTGAADELKKLGIGGLHQYVKGMAQQTGTAANLVGVSDARVAKEGVDRYDQQGVSSHLGLAGMSSAEINQAIKGAKTEGSNLAGLLPALRAEQKQRQRDTMMVGKRGANLAAMRAMGIDLDRTEMADVMTMKDPESIQKFMASKGYKLSTDDSKQFTSALTALKTNKLEVEYDEDTTDEERAKGAGKTKKTKKTLTGDAARTEALRQMRQLGEKSEAAADKELAPQRQKRQDDTAAKNDPSFRMLSKIAASMDALSTAIATQNSQNNVTPRKVTVAGTVKVEGMPPTED